MGNNDLRDMQAGLMDRSGEDTTRTGRICGIIATILLIAGVVIVIPFLLMFGLMIPGMSR